MLVAVLMLDRCYSIGSTGPSSAVASRHLASLVVDGGKGRTPMYEQAAIKPGGATILVVLPSANHLFWDG
jgi:hypothetical protein